MKYLEELRRLNLPKEEYAIFGSGPLAIRGLRDNEDIDVIVKKGLWEKLKDKYEKEGGGLVIGHIEIFKTWPPFYDINELIDNADIIKGIPFVKLEKVLEWKETRNKKKDQKDIELIKGNLKK